ncbi:hypothetical protein A3Q34_06135 [Colwellia sp. PAMC 20917]|uniref:NAD-dependent epimerase/dehydratase family protein n=1 Tax=Colwellia sp. PAMC 20917 TaxID=1816218 RepID=UPI000878246E|nr:NAD-dependent epimerase/dehydratase family protein [Colwellia sp. PAMC 20917]AOW76473.1 hypothetical protein A3Q34_06135 [Colwellia sp. PAMC 20917]
MKVAITGASGYIGTKFIEHYSNEVDIVAITRNRKYEYLNKVIINSLNDITANNLADVNCIVHLAGLAHSNKYTLDNYNQVNVQGTINLARTAIKVGVKRFVYISSIGVYGNKSQNISLTEDVEPEPVGAQADSKLKTEIKLKKLVDSSEMELVIVRPAIVYGPSAPGNFNKLICIINKLSFVPFGLVNNARSFISINNICSFIYLVCKHPKAANEVFVIADKEYISIKNLTCNIAKEIGKPLIQVPIPIHLMFLTAKMVGKSTLVNNLIGNLRVDSSKANTLLGWHQKEKLDDVLSDLINVEKNND